MNEATPHPSIETGYESLVKQTEEGWQKLSVFVQGAYCAACIQKIESVAQHFSNVKEARFNFTTGAMRIEWDGRPDLANAMVAYIEGQGYDVLPYDPDLQDEAVKREDRFLLLCLGVAGFAMGNVMLLSVGVWSSDAETMGYATREFMHLLSALIACPVLLFSGRPFFRSALRALAGGHTNMDVPISVALLLATSMSLYELAHGGEHVYFDSVLMLIFFLLIGRYLEFRARKNAGAAALDLRAALSSFATILEGKNQSRVAVHEIKQGMIALVKAGEKIPADGIVIDGISEIDSAIMSGETLPRPVKKGSRLLAGTLNIAAPIKMEVSKAAQESLLFEVAELMDNAGQSNARYVRLADRAAQLYTPFVHVISLLAFLGWVFVGGMAWQEALMISVTVLIITCPCALGLAVPVVQVLATGGLMKRGVLVKSGDALERLAVIDQVIWDKTGTLTKGLLMPESLEGIPKKTQQIIISLAHHSSHVLAKNLAASSDVDLLELTHVKEYPAKGIAAKFEGKKIRLGARSWCGNRSAQPSQSPELWFEMDGEKPIQFIFKDSLRDQAEQVIDVFSMAGIKSTILSGDQEFAVKKAAQKLKIDDFYAAQSPKEKFEFLHKKQQAGSHVLMVGDGMNDTAVMREAFVSVAPGSAIDMAQNEADILFSGHSLEPVAKVWHVARKVQQLIFQNFGLAVIYNILAVPIALAGLVTPFVAAIAMSGSSLIVIANSFRLRSHL